MDDLLKALPGPWKTAALLFMVGVMAGAGGSFWRVDKFTGTQGRALDDRIIQLEQDKADLRVWQQAVRAELDAIRLDDRRTVKDLDEIKQTGTEHTEGAEEWKRRIQANEQAIENLWKWYQGRTQ